MYTPTQEARNETLRTLQACVRMSDSVLAIIHRYTVLRCGAEPEVAAETHEKVLITFGQMLAQLDDQIDSMTSDGRICLAITGLQAREKQA